MIIDGQTAISGSLYFTKAAEAAAHDLRLQVESDGRLATKSLTIRTLPAVEAKDLRAYVKESGVEILNSTATPQAVRHKGLKLTGAAFYEAGALDVPGGAGLAADKSCIMPVRELEDGAFRVAVCSSPGAKAVPCPSANAGSSFRGPGGDDALKTIVKDVKR